MTSLNMAIIYSQNGCAMIQNGIKHDKRRLK